MLNILPFEKICMGEWTKTAANDVYKPDEDLLETFDLYPWQPRFQSIKVNFCI